MSCGTSSSISLSKKLRTGNRELIRKIRVPEEKMNLIVQQLHQLAGPQGNGYNGKAPKRALFMRPEAARALYLLETDTGGLVYTDIYRSPQAIRDAYRAKLGTQPVAYSYHGYGGPVDLDTEASQEKLGTDYAGLIAAMEHRGFYCHRRDGVAGQGASESWHFNYLGDDAAKLLALTTSDHSTWARPAEAMIQKWYGPELQLTDEQVAVLLPVAHATDVKDFQRQWDLAVDGIAGPKTQRVLAFVTANFVVQA
jgi:hypothetical protein